MPDIRSFSGLLDRRLIVGLALLVALVAAVVLFGRLRGEGSAESRPQLMLMSSVPLQWGEANISDIANDRAGPSALFEHLSKANRLVMLDDFQKLGKPGAAPLLLVQPRALAPRELVELDGWIRKGGTAIIFADPALDWPSDLPLGDQRRPLFTSLLTPMFRHWGLELALPVGREPAKETYVGEYRIAPHSAGIWLVGKDKPSANCTVRADQLLASCMVGKGKALLVADADLLHEERWTDDMITSGTMTWLDALVAESRKQKPLPRALWENRGK